jgi:predicted alpha/beta-fold hydrolase
MSRKSKPLESRSIESTPRKLSAAQLIERCRQILAQPFKPHRAFKNGHAQTLASFFWPRPFETGNFESDEERLFEVDSGVRILGRCKWQPLRSLHPTMLLLHGLEGSVDSKYMLGTADKAFRAGFNVIRLNHRNCGNTEHLTPTLYNSGLSQDVGTVVRELSEVDGMTRLFLVGFSMSGNIVLKYAGELSGYVPDPVSAVCAISPSVDLAACEAAINRRSNWLYRERFMISLRSRMRRKQKLYPERYDTTGLRKVRTLREFDNRFTSKDGGYRDADDYYHKASSLKLIQHIRVPTLIIHAQDDPFIPFQPLLDPTVALNPNVLLLAPEGGGHVGFLADRNGMAEGAEDRFWAENRVVEFCRLVDQAN